MEGANAQLTWCVPNRWNPGKLGDLTKYGLPPVTGASGGDDGVQAEAGTDEVEEAAAVTYTEVEARRRLCKTLVERDRLGRCEEVRYQRCEEDDTQALTHCCSHNNNNTDN